MRRRKIDETAEEILGRPKGPYDRAGHVTGWRDGGDGRLIPYDIALPEEDCPHCKRTFPTTASLENHLKIDHPKD